MDLSLRALKDALEIRQQIDDLEKRLRALFDESPQSQPASAGLGSTKSAAAGTRSRAIKTEQSTTNRDTKSRKRGITAAGRKRLSEMMKARWAAKKKNTRA